MLVYSGILLECCSGSVYSSLCEERVSLISNLEYLSLLTTQRNTKKAYTVNLGFTIDTIDYVTGIGNGTFRASCPCCAQQRLPTTFKVRRHYSVISLSQSHYISAEVAYYISLRCVYGKKAHKKQQTIASFSQKLHKSSDTKKRRRPTHKQGVRLDTRTIVTKVPRAVYKDKQDALNKLYFGRISTSESQ